MSSPNAQSNSASLVTQTMLENSGEGQTSASLPPAIEQIDLLALAQKVYLLLKQELKLEQDRVGRTRRF